jgi:hypothetical protein
MSYANFLIGGTADYVVQHIAKKKKFEEAQKNV